jgi:hypothetical protein
VRCKRIRTMGRVDTPDRQKANHQWVELGSLTLHDQFGFPLIADE